MLGSISHHEEATLSDPSSVTLDQIEQELTALKGGKGGKDGTCGDCLDEFWLKDQDMQAKVGGRAWSHKVRQCSQLGGQEWSLESSFKKEEVLGKEGHGNGHARKRMTSNVFDPVDTHTLLDRKQISRAGSEEPF